MAKFSMGCLSLFMLISFGIAAHGQTYDYKVWTDANASCIGNNIAPGLIGNACGYGDVYALGYGGATAWLSSELFNNGRTCGACFQVQCRAGETKLCHPGKSVAVTATSFCAETFMNKQCAGPNLHFEIAYAAYGTLAPPNYDGTIIPIQFKRVPCVKTGGVRFSIDGSFFRYFIKVYNIAGPGNAQIAAIKGDKTDFINMDLAFGQIFSQSNNLIGQSLAFKVTVGDEKYGNTLTFWEVADANWKLGQTFESEHNFP